METKLTGDRREPSGLTHFLRFAGTGLLSTLADNLTFLALVEMDMQGKYALYFGRAVSVILNYLLLHFAVFDRKKGMGHSFPRYLLLVCFSTCVVGLALRYSPMFFNFHPIVPKVIVEAVMFFFNFFVSKYLIFRDSAAGEPS